MAHCWAAKTNTPRIARVVPGGPADQDGRLKAGDRITAVGQGNDGKMVDVIGWRVDDVVDLIRGPKDTVVRLEVLPEDVSVDGPPQLIEIVRNEVKLEEQAASSDIIEVPGDDRRRSGQDRRHRPAGVLPGLQRPRAEHAGLSFQHA